MSDIAEAGHNIDAVTAGHLRALVERIEHTNDEIKDLNEGKKDIFSEARSAGFDAKVIKKIVAIRAQDPDRRREEEAILEVYKTALGLA